MRAKAARSTISACGSSRVDDPHAKAYGRSMNPLTLIGALRVQRIIHGALMASVVVYAVIGAVVSKSTAEPTPPVAPTLVYTLVGVAAAILLVLPLLRRTLLPPMREGMTLPDDAPLDRAQTAIARLNTANILTWALTESAAIFGLVLTFLSHEPKYIYGLGAAAAVVLVQYAPRRAWIEQAVTAAKD